jgi:hypothetical protein
MRAKPSQVGAYGLALHGRGLVLDLLVPCPARWPLVEIDWAIDARSAVADAIGETHAVFGFTGGGSLTVERDRRRALFRVPSPISEAALVHPYLAPVGAVMAHWLGREGFHAGAIATANGAWALLGGRGTGKSTLLAWHGLNGIDVVSDDVLIVEEQTAFAGPRSVDLRADAATTLGAGEPLGVIGQRERWRVSLGPVAAELPLCGWIFLSWGDAVGSERVPARELLPRLLAQRVLRIPPARPTALLDLVSLPAFELTRPRRFDSLEQAAEQVAEIACGKARQRRTGRTEQH